LLGIFISPAEMTHVMEILTIGNHNYWVSGIVKAITALASVPNGLLLSPDPTGVFSGVLPSARG